MPNINFDKIIRLPKVLEMTAIGKSTAYNQITEGLLPPPIPLGARARGYLLSEIEAVIKARIKEESSDQIKKLVTELVSQRKTHGEVSR